ncbi:MAG: helix-turn-helix transcriptional regulator [Hyphomicrobium sp.]
MRNDRGWSQRDLAAAAGVQQRRIGEIELCTANPTLATLQRIAGSLQIEVSELLVRSTHRK